LRRLVVQHLVQIPDHRIGIEVAAVVEFHAPPELESPPGFVVVIDFPFGGEAGHQFAGPIRHVHFPGDQRIVNRIGAELIGAGAPIRLPGGQRNIRHRNAVPHNGFGMRCRGGQAGANGDRHDGKKDRISGAHELSSIGKGAGYLRPTAWPARLVPE
jgi:hypothetical protein